jgi:hypothetical protein
MADEADKMNPREWLKGKTIEDLNIAEQGGRLLFEDRIVGFGPGAKRVETPIRVRVPRGPEIIEGRREAKVLFKKKGLDLVEDAATFDELETVCILARAIRSAEAPFEQFALAEVLYSGFETKSLYDVWERMQTYQKLMDPRITDAKEEDVLAAAMGIAKVRNLSPLAAIAGSDLDTFVICMAVLLTRYLMLLSSSPLQTTSKPEP